MTLGEFIKQFSHNNIIRLVYKVKGGYEPVHGEWNQTSMDHEVLNARGKNRHFINNEVIGLVGIYTPDHYPETINIAIERLENQPQVKEIPRPQHFETAAEC